MSRLDDAINLVMESRKMRTHAWIYNKEGEISDDVICGDIIPFLNELKEYEINVSDAWMCKFLNGKHDIVFNTYNNGACVSNDIVVYGRNCNDAYIVAIAVHLFGDARCNYSDYFVCKFDSEYEFFGLESTMQSVEINNRYVADVNIFDECYSVYDYENNTDVGEFYEIEKSELLKELEERA